jgi:excisionase family DNA binding protein
MEGNSTEYIGHSSVMDVKDASKFLKISESKLRRLVNDRRIPFFRLDGRILFSRPALEQWIQTLIVQPVEKKNDVAATIWNTAIGG